MITAAYVTKHFGEVTAVNDISVTIRSGEVFGLIGTNGAGKSTFLRMAAGVIRPDSGKILMDEQPVCESGYFLYIRRPVFSAQCHAARYGRILSGLLCVV